MTEKKDEKKSGDLTALTDLSSSDSQSFVTSPDSDALPALEGMDDFLSPMSPTSVGAGEKGSSSFTFTADPDAPAESLTAIGEAVLLDPIASLPPVDADTLAAAAGSDSPPSLAPDHEGSVRLEDPVPPLGGTAIGAALADALSTSSAPMEQVRHYSDRVAPVATSESASTPFSLVIEGHLRPHERETLLAILSREGLGVREVELEPQFTAGHILIPRISEYAGVLIVQALRNTTAKMRLGPSERIFVSREAEDGDRLIRPPHPDSELFVTEDGTDPSSTMVLTSAESIPGRKLLSAIDTLHTSMNLKATHLAQPQSPLFQDAIERLKTQLKFQAFHRGANALVGFKYTLHPLEGQTLYKLVVEARAVRVENERT